MAKIVHAKFNLGQAVGHRAFEFGGIVVDVDAVFAGTEECMEAIPAEQRPRRDQPFYRVLVHYEGADSIVYISQQSLVADVDGRFAAPAHAPGATRIDPRDFAATAAH